MQALCDVILSLAKTEDAYVFEASTKYYNSIVRIDNTKFQEQYIDNYPILNKPRFKIAICNSKGWRLDWYHYLFGSHTPEKINSICQRYLEGIQWVMYYYFQETKASHSWYYPYSYSPTILDLSHFLSNAIHVKPDLDECSSNSVTHKTFTRNFNTDLHLLMVLPPQSYTLVNSKLSVLFEKYEYGVAHFYPKKFHISTFLKTYLWECSAILPDIEFDHLLKCYTRVINQNE
jgi:5'-3' exoribonuclease 1